MRLNKERGKSRTIIGAISSLYWVDMKFHVADKTNTFFFCEFLKYICCKSLCPDPRNTVIVLDNHAAHKSKKARKFAESLGVTLFFLPPTASELNPIERMWSYFKVRWRFLLSDASLYITPSNIDNYLYKCLTEVAGKSLKLSQGPLKELVLNNMEHRPGV